MVARYYGKLFGGYALIAVLLLLAEQSLKRIHVFPGCIVASLGRTSDSRALTAFSIAFLAIGLAFPVLSGGKKLVVTGWILFAILLFSIFIALRGAMMQGV